MDSEKKDQTENIILDNFGIEPVSEEKEIREGGGS